MTLDYLSGPDMTTRSLIKCKRGVGGAGGDVTTEGPSERASTECGLEDGGGRGQAQKCGWSVGILLRSCVRH